MLQQTSMALTLLSSAAAVKLGSTLCGGNFPWAYSMTLSANLPGKTCSKDDCLNNFDTVFPDAAKNGYLTLCQRWHAVRLTVGENTESTCPCVYHFLFFLGGSSTMQFEYPNLKCDFDSIQGRLSERLGANHPVKKSGVCWDGDAQYDRRYPKSKI